MVWFSLLLVSALLFVTVAATSDDLQPAKQQAVLGTFTPQGCWKDVILSKGEINKQVTFKASNLSSDGCGSRCLYHNNPVFAMSGDSCYCANKYPHEDGLVDDSECNYPCKANATEACGNKAKTRYSVWNTGTQVNVPNTDNKASSASSSSSAASTSFATGTSTSSKKSTKKTSSTTPTSSAETSTMESETSTTADSTTSSSASATSSTAAAQTSSGGSKDIIGAGVAVLAVALAL